MESTVRSAVRAVRIGLTLVVLAWPSATGLADPPRPPTGVVYVQSNDPTPGQNAVFGFHRNRADGRLTPLPGSPFATRGTGLANPTEELGPEDGDQQVVVTADHRFLLTINSGSHTIAVFLIRPNGSLVHVNGSPFPSGGLVPTSIGLAGRKVYVVNKGDQEPGQAAGGSRPNYTGFRMNDNGRLIPIPHSTIEGIPGSDPTQALVAPGGRNLFGIQLFAIPIVPPPGLPPFVPPFISVLDSFRIAPNGRLARAAGTPMPAPMTAGAPYMLGLQAHPTRRILYVGFVLSSQLGIYTYERDGRLTHVGFAPNSGLAICWIAIDPSARFLYTANSATASISAYSLADPLAPTEIQHLVLKDLGPPLPNPGATVFGTTPFELTVDPTGKSLYVVSHETAGGANPAGNRIHILQIGANGTLTEPDFSPLHLPVPGVANPQGVVAF